MKIVFRLPLIVLFLVNPVVGQGHPQRQSDISGVMPDVVRAYRVFHENPEVGLMEIRMSKYLRDQLGGVTNLKLESSEKLPTAVIAVLDTGKPGPVTALRADMDARPIETELREPGSHDPRSLIPGVMHNCGHDIHSAMLLGAAKYLAQNPAGLTGKIVFIFQPAEEVAGGADDLVNEGIIAKFGIQRMFAMHVVSGQPVGTISISKGATMAGSYYFDIKLKGRGGHAASPHATDDIPLLLSKVTVDLSELPARKLDILSRPALISVSQISAQEKLKNALPREGIIGGTIRCFEDAEKADGEGLSIKQLMESRLDSYKTGTVSYEFELRKGAPPLTNDLKLFEEVIPQLRSSWAERIDTTHYRGMFAEDFAYYTNQVPCLYFGVGISKDGLGDANVHSMNFTAHPEALDSGVLLFVQLAHISSRLPD